MDYRGGRGPSAHNWHVFGAPSKYIFISRDSRRHLLPVVERAERVGRAIQTDAVILIDVPDQIVLDRIMNRRLCAKCGLDYNLIFHRPSTADVCDVCGGALVARADDNPQALAVRLAAYHGETRPLIEIFQRKEFVATVDAAESVEGVQAAIRQSLDIPSGAFARAGR